MDVATISDKKPLLTVIVPVYNIEQYLAQAIDSVVGQSIGFTDNIELIIVDDGSSDSSLEIAQDYAITYPHNVVVVSQKNSGVSSARNAGLAKARGEFVHFFDGDDILSRNFYSQMIKFLRENKQVDFAAARLKFFDEIIDPHPLNYKFSSTRVIDLSKEPDNPILHVISCLFRRSAIEHQRFDTKLSIAEDVKFLSDVLVSNRRYGVVKKPVYHYRKRTSSASAIGGKERNRDYYMAVPNLAYKHMLDTWRASNGDSLPIEQTILYDLSYRLEQKSQQILSYKEQTAYVLAIKSLLASCSEEAILTNRHLSLAQKRYALGIKHRSKSAKSQKSSLGVEAAASLAGQVHPSVYLDFVTQLDDDTYKVEGYIDGAIDIPGFNWLADVGGEQTQIRFVERAQREKSFFGEVYDKGCAFEAEIKWPVDSELSFYLQTSSSHTKLPLQTGPFTRFGALPMTYRRDGARLIKKTPAALQSHAYSRSEHLLLELRMLLQICLNWRFGTVRQRLKKFFTYNLSQLSLKAKLVEIAKPWFFMAEAVYFIPRAILLRTLYYIAKPRKTRPLWLVSDRGMAAGDNGEALFRYIMQQSDVPADVYFVISKKSKDYQRLSSVGPVLNQDSLRYKLMFLLADKIISSQADVETINPFIRQRPHYGDLFEFDFVFLQHGVIRHNLSDWLNRFSMNISLFVTSANREYQSILDNPYYYQPHQVLLSGLPRHDLLENAPENKLLLIPTYRMSLAKRMKTDKNGARHYDPQFKDSQYRNFYNNLLNDPRLLAALKEASMTGEFYLHPAHAAQHRDFDSNALFKVMDYPYDYKQAFKTGSMLISDHSSVVFDFVYLKKPTAYAHFDADTFFDGHTYTKSNFFSDEDDGFGEVYYDYDTLVLGVIKSIENHCVMPAKYRKRVDDFFYKIDKNNSKRVYQAIIKQ